jgi:hypothetical protein
VQAEHEADKWRNLYLDSTDRRLDASNVARSTFGLGHGARPLVDLTQGTLLGSRRATDPGWKVEKILGILKADKKDPRLI